MFEKTPVGICVVRHRERTVSATSVKKGNNNKEREAKKQELYL